MGQSAPYLPLVIPVGTGSVGWTAASNCCGTGSMAVGKSHTLAFDCLPRSGIGSIFANSRFGAGVGSIAVWWILSQNPRMKLKTKPSALDAEVTLTWT